MKLSKFTRLIAVNIAAVFLFTSIVWAAPPNKDTLSSREQFIINEMLENAKDPSRLATIDYERVVPQGAESFSLRMNLFTDTDADTVNAAIAAEAGKRGKHNIGRTVTFMGIAGLFIASVILGMHNPDIMQSLSGQLTDMSFLQHIQGAFTQMSDLVADKAAAVADVAQNAQTVIQPSDVASEIMQAGFLNIGKGFLAGLDFELTLAVLCTFGFSIGSILFFKKFVATLHEEEINPPKGVGLASAYFWPAIAFAFAAVLSIGGIVTVLTDMGLNAMFVHSGSEVGMKAFVVGRVSSSNINISSLEFRLRTNGDINYWDEEIKRAAVKDKHKAKTLKILFHRGNNELSIKDIKVPVELLKNDNKHLLVKYLAVTIYNKGVSEGAKDIVILSDDDDFQNNMHAAVSKYIKTNFKHFSTYANFGDAINIMSGGSFDFKIKKELKRETFAPKAEGTVVGVDVGGTNIKIVIMKDGERIYERSMPVERERGGFWIKNTVMRMIEDALNANNLEAVDGIGVTFPSPIKITDAGEAKVVRLTNFERHWEAARHTDDFSADYEELNSIKESVQNRFKCENVAVLNDADAFGFWEVVANDWKQGPEANKGIKVILPIGTGPGYVKICDGVIENIPHQGGHMVIDMSENAPADAGCGVQGCYGAFVPASAMKVMAENVGIDISERNEIICTDINKMIKLLKNMGEYIAIQAAKIHDVTGTTEILLAGGVTQDETGKELIRYANEALAQKYPELEDKIKISLSDKDLNWSGAMGAAQFANMRAQKKEIEEKVEWEYGYDLPEIEIGHGVLNETFESLNGSGKKYCIFTTSEVYEYMAKMNYPWFDKDIDWVFIDDKDISTVQKQVAKGGYSVICVFGAGKVTDWAKHIGKELAAEVFAIPTTLSGNAMFTEKAVFYVGDGDERERVSEFSGPPSRAVIDVGLLEDFTAFESPQSRIDGRRAHIAGAGDIVSIYTALLDWKLADKEGVESVDKVIYDRAERLLNILRGSFDNISLLNTFSFVILSEIFAEASLLNMRYRTSRPKDGAEHLVADEIDRRMPDSIPRLHGEIVAIASIITSFLYRDEYDLHQFNSLRKMIKKMGLPVSMDAFDVGPNVAHKIIVDSLTNIHTRADKYTYFDKFGPISREQASEVFEILFGKRSSEIDQFENQITQHVSNSLRKMSVHIDNEIIPALKDPRNQKKIKQLVDALIETRKSGGRVNLNAADRIGEIGVFFLQKLRALGFHVDDIREITPEFLIEPNDLILTLSGSGKTGSVVRNVENMDQLVAAGKYSRNLISITSHPEADIWKKCSGKHSVIQLPGRAKTDLLTEDAQSTEQWLPFSSSFEYSVMFMLEGIIESLVRYPEGASEKEIAQTIEEVVSCADDMKTTLCAQLMEIEDDTSAFVQILKKAVTHKSATGENVRIYLFGMGQNNYVARLFARRLQNMGFEVFVAGPRDIVSKPHKEDIAIFISNSGERQQTIDKIKAAKGETESSAGVRCMTVAVTANSDSSLAQEADLVLPISVMSTASHTAHIMENSDEAKKQRQVKRAFELTSMFYLEGVTVALMKELNIKEHQFEHVYKEWEVNVKGSVVMGVLTALLGMAVFVLGDSSIAPLGWVLLAPAAVYIFTALDLAGQVYDKKDAAEVDGVDSANQTRAPDARLIPFFKNAVDASSAGEIAYVKGGRLHVDKQRMAKRPKLLQYIYFMHEYTHLIFNSSEDTNTSGFKTAISEFTAYFVQVFIGMAVVPFMMLLGHINERIHKKAAVDGAEDIKLEDAADISVARKALKPFVYIVTGIFSIGLLVLADFVFKGSWFEYAAGIAGILGISWSVISLLTGKGSSALADAGAIISLIDVSRLEHTNMSQLTLHKDIRTSNSSAPVVYMNMEDDNPVLKAANGQEVEYDFRHLGDFNITLRPRAIWEKKTEQIEQAFREIESDIKVIKADMSETVIEKVRFVGYGKNSLENRLNILDKNKALLDLLNSMDAKVFGDKGEAIEHLRMINFVLVVNKALDIPTDELSSAGIESMENALNKLRSIYRAWKAAQNPNRAVRSAGDGLYGAKQKPAWPLLIPVAMIGIGIFGFAAPELFTNAVSYLMSPNLLYALGALVALKVSVISWKSGHRFMAVIFGAVTALLAISGVFGPEVLSGIVSNAGSGAFAGMMFGTVARSEQREFDEEELLKMDEGRRLATSFEFDFDGGDAESFDRMSQLMGEIFEPRHIVEQQGSGRIEIKFEVEHTGAVLDKFMAMNMEDFKFIVENMSGEYREHMLYDMLGRFGYILKGKGAFIQEHLSDLRENVKDVAENMQRWEFVDAGNDGHRLEVLSKFKNIKDMYKKLGGDVYKLARPKVAKDVKKLFIDQLRNNPDSSQAYNNASDALEEMWYTLSEIMNLRAGGVGRVLNFFMGGRRSSDSGMVSAIEHEFATRRYLAKIHASEGGLERFRMSSEIEEELAETLHLNELYADPDWAKFCDQQPEEITVDVWDEQAHALKKNAGKAKGLRHYKKLRLYVVPDFYNPEEGRHQRAHYALEAGYVVVDKAAFEQYKTNGKTENIYPAHELFELKRSYYYIRHGWTYAVNDHKYRWVDIQDYKRWLATEDDAIVTAFLRDTLHQEAVDVLGKLPVNDVDVSSELVDVDIREFDETQLPAEFWGLHEIDMLGSSKKLGDNLSVSCYYGRCHGEGPAAVVTDFNSAKEAWSRDDRDIVLFITPDMVYGDFAGSLIKSAKVVVLITNERFKFSGDRYVEYVHEQNKHIPVVSMKMPPENRALAVADGCHVKYNIDYSSIHENRIMFSPAQAREPQLAALQHEIDIIDEFIQKFDGPKTLDRIRVAQKQGVAMNSEYYGKAVVAIKKLQGMGILTPELLEALDKIKSGVDSKADGEGVVRYLPEVFHDYIIVPFEEFKQEYEIWQHASAPKRHVRSAASEEDAELTPQEKLEMGRGFSTLDNLHKTDRRFTAYQPKEPMPVSPYKEVALKLSTYGIVIGIASAIVLFITVLSVGEIAAREHSLSVLNIIRIGSVTTALVAALLSGKFLLSNELTKSKYNAGKILLGLSIFAVVIFVWSLFGAPPLHLASGMMVLGTTQYKVHYRKGQSPTRKVAQALEDLNEIETALKYIKGKFSAKADYYTADEADRDLCHSAIEAGRRASDFINDWAPDVWKRADTFFPNVANIFLYQKSTSPIFDRNDVNDLIKKLPKIREEIRAYAEEQGMSVRPSTEGGATIIEKETLSQKEIEKIARDIQSGKSKRQVIITSTGNDVFSRLNKFKGVRAAICHDKDAASMTRDHNNANILIVPSLFTTPEQRIQIINEFVSHKFSEEGNPGRHTIRVNKIDDMTVYNEYEPVKRTGSKNKVIAVGNDHGATELALKVVKYLEAQGYTVVHVGTDKGESCHYPDFAQQVARGIDTGAYTHGIVLCTTGIGISMSVSRGKDVNCALCRTPEEVEVSVNEDTNVLGLGAKFVDPDKEEFVESFEVKEMIDAFIRQSDGSARPSTEGGATLEEHEGLIRPFLADLWESGKMKQYRCKDWEAELEDEFSGDISMLKDYFKQQPKKRTIITSDGRKINIDSLGKHKKIRVYAVPGLLRATGHAGHFALRDGIVYVDKDVYDRSVEKLYEKYDDEASARMVAFTLVKHEYSEGLNCYLAGKISKKSPAQLVEMLDDVKYSKGNADLIAKMHDMASPIAPEVRAITDEMIPDNIQQRRRESADVVIFPAMSRDSFKEFKGRYSMVESFVSRVKRDGYFFTDDNGDSFYALDSDSYIDSLLGSNSRMMLMLQELEAMDKEGLKDVVEQMAKLKDIVYAGKGQKYAPAGELPQAIRGRDNIIYSKEAYEEMAAAVEAIKTGLQAWARKREVRGSANMDAVKEAEKAFFEGVADQHFNWDYDSVVRYFGDKVTAFVNALISGEGIREAEGSLNSSLTVYSVSVEPRGRLMKTLKEAILGAKGSAEASGKVSGEALDKIIEDFISKVNGASDWDLRNIMPSYKEVIKGAIKDMAGVPADERRIHYAYNELQEYLRDSLGIHGELYGLLNSLLEELEKLDGGQQDENKNSPDLKSLDRIKEWFIKQIKTNNHTGNDIDENEIEILIDEWVDMVRAGATGYLEGDMESYLFQEVEMGQSDYEEALRELHKRIRNFVETEDKDAQRSKPQNNKYSDIINVLLRDVNSHEYELREQLIIHIDAKLSGDESEAVDAWNYVYSLLAIAQGSGGAAYNTLGEWETTLESWIEKQKRDRTPAYTETQWENIKKGDTISVKIVRIQYKNENPQGLVGYYNGIKVFIPASQAGYSINEFEGLVGEILEFVVDQKKDTEAYGKQLVCVAQRNTGSKENVAQTGGQAQNTPRVQVQTRIPGMRQYGGSHRRGGHKKIKLDPEMRRLMKLAGVKPSDLDPEKYTNFGGEAKAVVAAPKDKDMATKAVIRFFESIGISAESDFVGILVDEIFLAHKEDIQVSFSTVLTAASNDFLVFISERKALAYNAWGMNNGAEKEGLLNRWNSLVALEETVSERMKVTEADVPEESFTNYAGNAKAVVVAPEDTEGIIREMERAVEVLRRFAKQLEDKEGIEVVHKEGGSERYVFKDTKTFDEAIIAFEKLVACRPATNPGVFLGVSAGAARCLELLQNAEIYGLDSGFAQEVILHIPALCSSFHSWKMPLEQTTMEEEKVRPVISVPISVATESYSITYPENNVVLVTDNINGDSVDVDSNRDLLFYNAIRAGNLKGLNILMKWAIGNVMKDKSATLSSFAGREKPITISLDASQVRAFGGLTAETIMNFRQAMYENNDNKDNVKFVIIAADESEAAYLRDKLDMPRDIIRLRSDEIDGVELRLDIGAQPGAETVFEGDTVILPATINEGEVVNWELAFYSAIGLLNKLSEPSSTQAADIYAIAPTEGVYVGFAPSKRLAQMQKVYEILARPM